MRCSKDEGLLMLNKWLHDSTDLILWGCGYKTSRFAWGGKFQLEAGQNFVCRPIGSIHIPSESAKFNYGDVASMLSHKNPRSQAFETLFRCK